MLYTKDNFPQVNEIVKCMVKKIYGNTVFVSVDEYEKEGVLTISEIAPGRIRNLRDFVVENKTIICKVLRVDEKQNRIDVSLRRVPIPVMKEKLEEIKREEFSEKMYIDIAEVLNTNKDELFERTYEDIFENYDIVFNFLYDVMLDNDKINLLKNLTEEEKKIFIQEINIKIKPEEVKLKKDFFLSSLEENGVNDVKNAIKESLKTLNYDKIKIIYLAASHFEIIISHDELKLADRLYKKFTQNLDEIAKKNKLNFKFKE